MINKDNNYSSINKNSLLDILKRKKGTLVAVSGVLATVTILSGCSQTKEDFYSQPQYARPPVTHEIKEDSVAIISEDITQTDLFSFEPSVKYMAIEATNLDDTYELSNYTNLVQLSLDNNVITSADGLAESPDLMLLSVRNNSIKELDLTKFKSLRVLYIEGNYNLYTKEILDYCNNNGITVDIDEQDVANVETLKGMLKELDLEGKTEDEKEKIICDYVCKHMKYDTIGSTSDLKSQEYNQNILDNSIKGKGVCINYAEMFTAMCQLSGVDCFTIKGFASNSLINTNMGGPHAWNLVEIDGQYMLCDPTWIDGNGIFGGIYYNKSGEQGTKEFEKRHDSGKIVELLASNSNQKQSDDINKTTSGIDKFFESVDKYIEILQTEHGITREQLMKIMLTGAAAGTVILIGASACRKLQPVIEEKKRKKQFVKEEKEKTKLHETKKQPVIKKEEVKKTQPVVKKQVVERKNMTMEQVLASLPTNDDKIVYLEDLAEEKLREAARLQVDLETANGDLITYDTDEQKLNNAMNEIIKLALKQKDERALYRCKKYGYIDPMIKLGNLDIHQREILEATKRMYAEVDEKSKEYIKIYLTKLSLQKYGISNSDERTIASMKSHM